jgi:hypothetical protein
VRILTRKGWLTCDGVKPGDETIGYNFKTGRSEWTRITHLYCYEDAEVWRVGNKHWHANVTPNHRWWSDTRIVRSPEDMTECPECGWAGRRDREGIPATPRSISTHRGRMHGIKGEPFTAYRGEFVRTADLRGEHRIRLAAPADTDGIPGLSMEDVRVIAWLQGDGHVSRVLAKPGTCPECGWLPGTGRKPHRGAVAQRGNSVAVHRAKKHGLGKDVTQGEPAGWDGSIYQSKPAQVVKLQALLADIDHSEFIRERGGNTMPAHQFRLRRVYVTDLMKRSRLAETSPESFVLALSPDQRAAWLDSMIDAEGYRQPVVLAEGGKRHGASGEFVRIAQVDGSLQDAIKLAVYLEGYRPTFSPLSAKSRGYQPSGHVGMARPHVAPSMFTEHEVLERQPVWCVTTELGTWTAEQDGLPFLTGNSTLRPTTGPAPCGTSTTRPS